MKIKIGRKTEIGSNSFETEAIIFFIDFAEIVLKLCFAGCVGSLLRKERYTCFDLWLLFGPPGAGKLHSWLRSLRGQKTFGIYFEGMNERRGSF